MSIKKELLKLLHKSKSLVLKRKFKTYKNLYYKENYLHTKRLIVFFVPDGTDRINGGILSICSIYSIVKDLKHIHNCDVIASFLPNRTEHDYKYRNFKNDMVIYSFNEIKNHFNELSFLEIHIPDVMVDKFNTNNIKMSPFFKWVEKIIDIKVNILNQNDLFMPNIDYVTNLKKTFPNITMTLAHIQYATVEKRNYYGMPLHLFSAWLSPTPYKLRNFSEKENLILYSPDNIQSVPNGSSVSKKDILTSLKKNLKHYKFVEIKGMKYDTYKEYASKSKFAITFGEGLDGYFTETIFSGGISFAVYNEIFFTEDFKNLDTLYSSFDNMMAKIVTDIKYFDNKTNYDYYHNIQSNIVSKMYSFEKLKNNIMQFYLNNFDLK